MYTLKNSSAREKNQSKMEINRRLGNVNLRSSMDFVSNKSLSVLNNASQLEDWLFFFNWHKTKHIHMFCHAMSIMHYWIPTIRLVILPHIWWGDYLLKVSALQHSTMGSLCFERKRSKTSLHQVLLTWSYSLDHGET